jgi:hypothetical protein
MGSAANGHASARTINNLLDALNQLRHIAKSRRTVCISKERILAANMTKAMRNAAALAPVLGQRHNSQHIVQAVLLREIEHHVDRLVAAAVVDNDDFVTAEALVFCIGSALHMPLLGCRRERVLGAGSRSSGASKVLVQVLDGLFQRGNHTILFIVRGEDDAEEELRGFNGTDVRRRICSV